MSQIYPVIKLSEIPVRQRKRMLNKIGKDAKKKNLYKAKDNKMDARAVWAEVQKRLSEIEEENNV